MLLAQQDFAANCVLQFIRVPSSRPAASSWAEERSSKKYRRRRFQLSKKIAAVTMDRGGFHEP